jgi:hypothetical protein
VARRRGAIAPACGRVTGALGARDERECVRRGSSSASVKDLHRDSWLRSSEYTSGSPPINDHCYFHTKHPRSAPATRTPASGESASGGCASCRCELERCGALYEAPRGAALSRSRGHRQPPADGRQGARPQWTIGPHGHLVSWARATIASTAPPTDAARALRRHCDRPDPAVLAAHRAIEIRPNPSE